MWNRAILYFPLIPGAERGPGTTGPLPLGSHGAGDDSRWHTLMEADSAALGIL